MNHDDDRDVNAWLDEVSDVPPGDFADVLRRAQQLPGAKVSDQDIAEAEALPADEDALRARLAFGTLEDFLDDAAVFVAAQGHERPPPMRALQVEPTGAPRRGAWAWGVAGLAAVAAVAALWVALPAGLLGTEDDSRSHTAAVDRHTPSEGSQAVVPPMREAPRPPPEVGPEPEPEVHPALDPEPEHEEREGETETDVDADAPQDVAPRHTVAELDTMAREAWRAGELGRARRLFERVVARGRGERADIAYGDLFTLARRQGDDAGLRRYWKRYATRFPEGRYIDDARAGLCRAATGEARSRCWKAYLKARPRGTFRADAEAALQNP